MIPYSYNMVDMGGIDLAEANGTVVEGLYNRLALARNACGDLILYNWKFAEIEIAPAPCSTLDEGTKIVINGLIQVTEQDEVTVPGINSNLTHLVVTENGQYDPSDYDVDGFSQVTVSLPLISLTVNENGTYDPSDYDAEGFSQVTVSVESGVTMDTLFSGSALCNSSLSIDLEAPYTDYLYVIIQGYIAVSGKNYNIAALAPCDISTGESNRIGFTSDTSYAWLYFNTSTNLKLALSDSATKYITKIIGIKE